MKIALVLGAMLATTAQSRQVSNPEAVRKLMTEARRLDQNYQAAGDDAEGEEGILEVEDELMNYSLKLLKCEQEESLVNNDDGNPIYGVAIIRACPQDSCSNSKQGGCRSGHADLAVPLSSFVAAYIEDQAGNMQWDDQMDVENFAQCAQYVIDQNDDGYAADYYVGPACSDDGLDVKLDLFKDEDCRKKSDKSFEDISNGWSLPFSDGGLVSNQCLSCGEYSDDDGSYVLKDMCAELYEDAALKCEDWDIQHYYWDGITEVYRFGLDTTGCKRIGWMDKSPEPFSEWASIFILSFLVVASVAGAVWYTMWWKKQKVGLEIIDDEEDDDSNYQPADDDSQPSGTMGLFA